MKTRPDFSAFRRLIAESEVTEVLIATWLIQVAWALRDMSSHIHGDHHRKVSPVREAHVRVEAVREAQIALGLRPVEEWVLRFLTFSYELGVLAHAVRETNGAPRSPRTHGQECADLLRSYLQLTPPTPLWHSMLLAMERHDTLEALTLHTVEGDHAAFALASVMRSQAQLAN